MLRIKEICAEKGITLQELSKKLGVTYHTLYRAMSGNPELLTMIKIAKALDVPFLHIFQDFKPYIKKHGRLKKGG